MPSNTLENASPEIKLAVDIILILEANQIPPEVALKALEIVKSDFQNKQKQIKVES